MKLSLNDIVLNFIHVLSCKGFAMFLYLLRTDDAFLNNRQFFVKICLLFILFSQQNWGYLTRSNLDSFLVVTRKWYINMQ
jgi:hypothetical protein